MNMNDILRITACIYERIDRTCGQHIADFVVILTLDDGDTQTSCTDRVGRIHLFGRAGFHVGS